MNYERIDELLKERHMSRRELARRAGISIDNMQTRFTRKSKTIPLPDIMAMARVLGVDVAEIAFTEDERRVWQSEQPRWISVKDRLPENDNEVITAYKIDDEKAMKKRKGKLFVKTGNWTGYRWISVWDEYKSYAIEEEVLYWMPLPEPPKEEEQ